MAIVITLNSTFAHLSDDRTLSAKQNAASREREAIVDIAIGVSDTYTSNGILVDFSKVRRFKEVYSCEIVHNTYVLPVNFVPATGNDAATGKIKFFDSSGTELSNGSAAIQSKSLRVVIRGI